MYLREIEDEGPWPREAQQMNPHKIVQDPSCGWILPRLSVEVRMVGE